MILPKKKAGVPLLRQSTLKGKGFHMATVPPTPGQNPPAPAPTPANPNPGTPPTPTPAPQPSPAPAPAQATRLALPKAVLIVVATFVLLLAILMVAGSFRGCHQAGSTPDTQSAFVDALGTDADLRQAARLWMAANPEECITAIGNTFFSSEKEEERAKGRMLAMIVGEPGRTALTRMAEDRRLTSRVRKTAERVLCEFSQQATLEAAAGYVKSAEEKANSALSQANEARAKVDSLGSRVDKAEKSLILRQEALLAACDKAQDALNKANAYSQRLEAAVRDYGSQSGEARALLAQAKAAVAEARKAQAETNRLKGAYGDCGGRWVYTTCGCLMWQH